MAESVPLPEKVLAALAGYEPEGNPTSDTYDDLFRAFSTFNQALFKGELEAPLISIRAGKELGYFKGHNFRHSDTRRQFAHEIALNAEQFGLHSIEMCLANLVRQMVHQWQFQRGTRGRRGYENKEFVAVMERIGITVRKEEEGGGKGVYKEKHDDLLIHPDGPFMRVARQLLDEGFRARWADRFIETMRREFAAQQAAQQQVEEGTRAELEAGPEAEIPVEAANDPVATGEGTTGNEEGLSKASAAATAEEARSSVVGPDDAADRERAAGCSVPPISEAAIEFLAPPKPRDSKFKFQCPLCKACAWGKPSLHLVCGSCRVYMNRAEPDNAHLQLSRVVKFKIDWKAGSDQAQGKDEDVA